MPFSTIDQMQGSTLAQLASMCDKYFMVAARQILANMTLSAHQQCSTVNGVLYKVFRIDRNSQAAKHEDPK